MKYFILSALILFSFLLSSCGKKKSSGGAIPQHIAIEPEGVYTAVLYPISKSLNDSFNGKATITKYGDEFKVQIKFRNGTSGAHIQGLYSGEYCPDEESDEEALRDPLESEKYLGHLLIPFDGDLAGYRAGNDFFPTSKDYDYVRSTSYALMLSDPDLTDKSFKLEGRIVVIHEGPRSNDPGSSVPIACGFLRSSSIEEPIEDEEPEVTPVRVKPRREPKPDRTVKPDVVHKPEVERHRTLWERVRDRFGRWWRRLRGRKEYKN